MNNEILIKAKFRGHDGSLGYRKGKKYILWYKDNRLPRFSLAWFINHITDVYSGFPIEIMRISNSKEYHFGFCIYASDKAFRRNWTDLKFFSPVVDLKSVPKSLREGVK